MAQAQSELKSSETDLEQLTVRAPVEGQVLQLKVHLGEFAAAAPAAGGQPPLILLGSVTPLNVRCDVDEKRRLARACRRACDRLPRGNTKFSTPLRSCGLNPMSCPRNRSPATARSALIPACCKWSSDLSGATCQSLSASRWTCSLTRRSPCKAGARLQPAGYRGDGERSNEESSFPLVVHGLRGDRFGSGPCDELTLEKKPQQQTRQRSPSNRSRWNRPVQKAVASNRELVAARCARRGVEGPPATSRVMAESRIGVGGAVRQRF